AGTQTRGRNHVPHRAAVRGRGGAGFRRRHRRSSESALELAAHCGRARRSSHDCGARFRTLSAPAWRTSWCCDLRRQYGRSEFRCSSVKVRIKVLVTTETRRQRGIESLSHQAIVPLKSNEHPSVLRVLRGLRFYRRNQLLIRGEKGLKAH